MWRRGEGVVNEMEREEITGGITEFQGKGWESDVKKLHAIKAQPCAWIPHGRAESSGGGAISSETAGGGANQGNRETGTNKTAHLGVGAFPFFSEAGSEPFGSSCDFFAEEPIYGKDQGSERTALSNTESTIFGFLFTFLAKKHLGGVGVAGGRVDLRSRRKVYTLVYTFGAKNRA
jgi:hypothetical protein